MAVRGPKPSKRVLGGIEWGEHYNVYRALIDGWLELGFSYESKSNAYKVVVAGKILKERAPNPETAAFLARIAARAFLQRALEKLKDKGV